MISSVPDITFEDVQVGDRFTTAVRQVTEQDVVEFARLSGDYHPEHMDEEYGRRSIHGGRTAHGVLILAMATGLVNETGLFETTTIAVLQITVRFVKAARFGDTITTVATINGKRVTSKPDRGIVTLGITVFNQNSIPLLEGEWLVMVSLSTRKILSL